MDINYNYTPIVLLEMCTWYFDQYNLLIHNLYIGISFLILARKGFEKDKETIWILEKIITCLSTSINVCSKTTGVKLKYFSLEF
jgi:hypothetical protein